MSYQQFVDSLGLLLDPDALRRQMQQDGYLYIPSLLPQKSVREVYDSIMRLCQAAGWVDEHQGALGAPRLEGTDDWWEVYDPLQRLEPFHALAHRPELIAVVEALVQEAVLVHPRNIARITFPGAEHFTTPAHQDYPLIQGTPDTFTAWIPLCDCPGELGGLAILAGSHRAGLLPVHAAAGPGGLSVRTEDLGLNWHGQDLNKGDVLFFDSHTVHAARPNISRRGVRVSADYRYQGATQPVVADSLLPHYGRQSWEEIFAGWERTDLPYYWTHLPLRIASRDGAIQQPIEARSGNLVH